MGVPVDEDVSVVGGEKLCGRRYSQLVAVTHMNHQSADLEHQRQRQPGIADGVGIAAHGFYRGDLPEFVKNLIAYVAGVNDQLDPVQRSVHSGPQEPVGIGDESDGLTIRRARGRWRGCVAHSVNIMPHEPKVGG